MTALCFAQQLLMQTPAKNIVKKVNLLPSDALLPLLECVSNSIISLNQSNLPVEQRKITIEIVRGEPKQGKLVPSDNPIRDAIITDNGIGFTERNYLSFQTPHSDTLEEYGCLGVGRFSILAAFREMKIRSNFRLNGKWKYREFSFDADREVIPIAYEDSKKKINETVVELKELFNDVLIDMTEIPLEKIGQAIMRHFFLFHLSGNLPQIILHEKGGEPVKVNDLFSDESQEKEREFHVQGHSFKLYITCSSKKTNRRHHYYRYCADSRVVGRAKRLSSLDSIFSYPLIRNGSDTFLNVYVVSKYLDERKYPTRNGFRIPATPEDNSYDGEITFQDIGHEIADTLRKEYSDHAIETQQLAKVEWTDYIKTRPAYHRLLNDEAFLRTVPPGTPDEKKEEYLYRFTFNARKKNEAKLRQIIDEREDSSTAIETELSTKADLDKDALAEYMVKRRTIIELFRKYLRKNEHGNYPFEADVHNLIFPKGHTNEDAEYEAHNLWLLDERLVSFHFIGSHKPISSYSDVKSGKAADLVLVNNPISVGDKSEGQLGCLVVFEFKRPGDVAANKSGYHWDLAAVIDEYFDEFQYGQRRQRNQQGASVVVDKDTPKFGYIILDEIPEELQRYNLERKQWYRTPFNTLYKIVEKSHLHLEALTFHTLINSVEQRHSPFFDRLFRPKG